MLKGIGRSPFGPRPRNEAGGGAVAEAPSAVSEVESPEPQPAAPPPPPPVPVHVAPPVDPEYEALKRQIHSRLVDRLDLNRVGEMDQATLRSEIRILVERLGEAEKDALNGAER
jgi:pilus assembly protein CpaF